jgi:tetratricopeptide (TPR) repeat protein/predicted Ser/Thr protein kinase
MKNPTTISMSTEGLPAREAATIPPSSLQAECVDDVPLQFGRYAIQRRLGSGGMGAVYLADDTLLGRRVALKVPHQLAVSSPQAVERFYREARAAAQLDHPGICRVHDVGSFQDRPYITMAFVEGEPLSDHVARYVGRPREAAELVAQVACALAEAHARGVIHRDLKPANIMLAHPGRPVILDFGLARVPAGPEAGQTAAGMIMGTPAYMAPEQASGDPSSIGPAADIYSLGVVLYELMTGRTPFIGTGLDILVQAASTPVPPPSALKPGTDPVLEAVCLKALAREPEDRFPSAGAFAAALEDYLAGRVIEALDDNASPTSRAIDAVLRALRGQGWDRGLPAALSVAGKVPGLAAQASEALCRWLEGADEADARAHFADATHLPALEAWREVGKAHAHLRAGDLDRTLRIVEELAAAGARQADPALEADLALLRAYVLTRLGEWTVAASWLHLGLERVGPDHPLAVSILAALAHVHAGQCHYHAACEMLRLSARKAETLEDEAAQAATAEALGKIHLDWDRLDLAEEVLNQGWKIAQKCRDSAAEARLIHLLGRTEARRAEEAAAAGKRAAADKRSRQAADYFAWAAREAKSSGRAVDEALARRESARIHLQCGSLEAASEELNRAEELLAGASSPLAQAAVQRTRAALLRAEGRHEEVHLLLQKARAAYEERHRVLEAARTQLELARALAAANVPQRMVVRAFQDALSRAEECRHDGLVREIDQELESLDEEAHWRLLYERVRNTASPLFPAALNVGAGEVISVICLEFADFEEFCRGQEADALLQTLNQLAVDFECVVRRHRGHVISYPGGGMLALMREGGHAERAVSAALELRNVASEFNRPRGPLGLPLLPAQIGVATGPAFLGNLGTYRYMCFTPVGPVVNLASALARQASPSAPSISQATQDQVRERFAYTTDSPRMVLLSSRDTRRVWDVSGMGRVVTRPGSSRRTRRDNTTP